MPTKRCSSGGKSGFKYGNQGKCYTGQNAKSQANQQGRAIKANQNKK